MRRILLIACLLLMMSSLTLAHEDEPTPYEIALERILEAERTEALSLDLRGLGLTEVPPEIGNLTNLRALSLRFNQLTTLPREIGKLSQLCSLDIRNNQFVHLPTVIGDLDALILPTFVDEITWNTCVNPHHYAQLQVTNNLLITPPQDVLDEGTPAILGYLRNQAWWHIQRLLIGLASGIGFIALLILGLRMFYRRNRKPKVKRGDI